MIRNRVLTDLAPKSSGHFRSLRNCTRLLAAPLVAGVASIAMMPIADSHASQAAPPFAIAFHTISSSGAQLSSGCFRLSTMLGQPSPGYSATEPFSLFAGFMVAVPGAQPDEIFFDGLQEC